MHDEKPHLASQTLPFNVCATRPLSMDRCQDFVKIGDIFPVPTKIRSEVHDREVTRYSNSGMARPTGRLNAKPGGASNMNLARADHLETSLFHSLDPP